MKDTDIWILTYIVANTVYQFQICQIQNIEDQ